MCRTESEIYFGITLGDLFCDKYPICNHPKLIIGNEHNILKYIFTFSTFYYYITCRQSKSSASSRVGYESSHGSSLLTLHIQYRDAL